MAVNKIRPSRLTQRTDFEKIKKQGHRIGSSWMFANYLKNEKLGLRVGWTIPVYVGPAVVRNRLKRWMREDLKHLSSEIIGTSLDVNLVLRRQSANFYREMKHEVLTDVLLGIFRKLPKT